MPSFVSHLAPLLATGRGRSTDLRDADYIERSLAICRAVVAAGVLLAAYLDASHYAEGASIVATAFAYFGFAVAILLISRFRPLVETRAAIHLVDIAWVGLLTDAGAASGMPFFVLFLFLLLAAAWRWRFVEVTNTGVVLATAFVIRTSLLGATLCLLLGTVFISVIAARERRLRDEKSLIAHTLSKARVDAGVTQSVQDILDEIRSFYEAPRVVLVVHEKENGRIFLAERRESQTTRLQFEELDSLRGKIDLFPVQADVWRLRWDIRRRRFRSQGVDAFGHPTSKTLAPPPDRFWDLFPCRSFLAAVTSFGEDLDGRLYILDSRHDSGNRSELMFLQRIVRPVIPALYNVYLWRRLRAKIGAMERARVARELHDGIVQSLIGIEMQLDVMRRQTSGSLVSTSRDIGRIQEQLKNEIQNVRALMNEMRPASVYPDAMVAMMAELVDRFATGTSIAASFIADGTDSSLPPQVCRELVQILQEALTNVRKHSDARNVMIRFKSARHSWTLTIEDDGRGFAFNGHLSLSQLDEQHVGPAVIKERVRLIQGSLEIESSPGRGSILKVELPKHIYA
jgi:signal transduction histidine kinase